MFSSVNKQAHGIIKMKYIYRSIRMIKPSKLFIFVVLFTTIGFSRQPANVKIEMNLDNKGNSDLIFSRTLDASSWQNWLNIYGNNAALLKHDYERKLPSYYISDFQLKKDEVNRSYNISLKAYGVCKISNNGEWILETGDKNVELTKLGSKTFMYTSSLVEDGGITQQIVTIHLPDQSRNLRIENDAFGKTIVKFAMDGSNNIQNILASSGVLLVFIGGTGVFYTRRKPKVNIRKTQTEK
jgi:hypothetical protein